MMLAVTSDLDFAAELHNQLGAPALAPSAASRSPGFALGASVVFLGFSPGTQPLLEMEAFQHAPVLYLWGDERRTVVGPTMIAGMSPCPRCLAEDTTDPPCGTPAATRWAVATAALEANLITTLGTSTLLHRQLSWSPHGEGLELRRLSAHSGCSTPGCTPAP